MKIDYEYLITFDNLLGLIGYPLSHSFSKGYFSQKFKKELISGFFYESFPIESIELFPLLWERLPNLKGLNVTIPYKEQVLPFLEELDEAAEKIGAVNTIKRMPDGKLKGYNTDIIGFEQSLLEKAAASGLQLNKALVLGSGGAAKAVYFVLEKLGIDYKVVSRTQKKGDLLYQDITDEGIEKIDLIINTTPLGMSPNVNTFPDLPYEAMSVNMLLYDLVYNPEKTLFMQKGENSGAKTINGLQMLHLQAEAAWKIWTEK